MIWVFGFAVTDKQFEIVLCVLTVNYIFTTEEKITRNTHVQKRMYKGEQEIITK